jgi:uncharacterized membrane protein YeaQ/YmgE (transglycosylase-associated protein family)
MNFEMIVTTAIVGVLVGWLTGLVMKSGGYGAVGDIGLGVLGGVVGGFALWMQGIVAPDSRFAMLAAAVGAFILVVVQRKFLSWKQQQSGDGDNVAAIEARTQGSSGGR